MLNYLKRAYKKGTTVFSDFEFESKGEKRLF